MVQKITFVITPHDLVKMVEEQKLIDNNTKFIMEGAKDGKITYFHRLISNNENRNSTAEI